MEGRVNVSLEVYDRSPFGEGFYIEVLEEKGKWITDSLNYDPSRGDFPFDIAPFNSLERDKEEVLSLVHKYFPNYEVIVHGPYTM